MSTEKKQFAKSLESANVRVHHQSGEFMSTQASASQQNKAELQKLYSGNGYKDIKFWVPPNCTASQEECEAEVLNTLRAFVQDKDKRPANGTEI